MQKKTILAGMVGLVSLTFLSGCGKSVVSDNSSGNSDTQADGINIVKNNKLTVDENKCVGCGRCTKIASANFEMNKDRKAQVKSNEVSNQGVVDRAIANCPVKAISQ